MLQAERKEYAKTYFEFYTDFHKFCRECLGYKDMNSIHRELCDFLQYDQNKFKLVLMPRYTFKSSVCTVGYALWKLIRNPDTRILIYSDAATKAVGFLSSIKAHIEGKVAGSKFRDYFPSWETDPKSGKWNENQIVLSSRKTAKPEPNVDTGGEGTTKVGFHYDIIIFDDLVSDKNVTTKDQMDKCEDCYKKSLSLLRPGGEVIITGTRWHFGELYGRIIAESSIKGNFGLFIRKAEKEGKYLFSDIGEHSLTKDFLDRQRVELGSYFYSCLYQNEPTDDETRIFKTSDFAFYGAIKKDDLYITATCDPAGEGEDFTAITVVGTDHNMDMHILDIVNKHLQPSEIVSEIIRLHYKWTFKMFGLETNFYRGMLSQELERRIREERIANENFILFGVHEFEATARKGEGKHNRILGLQPYHERKALKFPGEKLELLQGDFRELSFQMFQFPHSAHDDIIDSLAYHLPLIRKGGVVKKQEFQENTPAWLEKQWLEKELERNAHLPRRWRRQLPTLAFS